MSDDVGNDAGHDARREDVAAVAIADTIRRYRQEWADTVRQSIEAELAKMEAEGVDAARGRGRGPRWAEGG